MFIFDETMAPQFMEQVEAFYRSLEEAPATIPLVGLLTTYRTLAIDLTDEATEKSFFEANRILCDQRIITPFITRDLDSDGDSAMMAWLNYGPKQLASDHILTRTVPVAYVPIEYVHTKLLKDSPLTYEYVTVPSTSTSATTATTTATTTTTKV